MESFEEKDSLQEGAGDGLEKKTAEVCSECGTPLEEGQEYCPKCGTPKKMVCVKCKAELYEGQVYCSKCGQKIGVVTDSAVSSVRNPFDAGADKENVKKKKTPIIVSAAVVIAMLVIIAGVKLVPKIFIDTAEYIEQGDLEKAWKKAKDDEDKQLVIDAYLSDGNYEEAYVKALSVSDKLQIKTENIAAVQGAFSAENLKNPSSFLLRDAYYREGTSDEGEINRQLVLYITGTNSYGGIVSSYWLYLWNNENEAWEFFTSVFDLSDEEYSEYDDDDEKIDILLENIARESIRRAMREGTQLNKEGVKRINQMFEDDKLDQVEMLDLDQMEYESSIEKEDL